MSVLVSVHVLMKRPGAMKELELEFVVENPIGTEVAAIQSGEKLAIDLRLESVHEGILATGEISGQCCSK